MEECRVPILDFPIGVIPQELSTDICSELPQATRPMTQLQNPHFKRELKNESEMYLE